jgi:hypothetical protein
MFRNGQLLGSKVTPNAVSHADDIYGPSLFELKEKTKKRALDVVDLTDKIPTIVSEQTMHTGMMYVQSIPSR